MSDFSFLQFVLLALASYRITHLVVYDAIFAPVRNFFVASELDGCEDAAVGDVRGWFGKLISCFWCTGVWISGFVTLAYWWQPKIAFWVCLWLAVAAVQSLLESSWLHLSGSARPERPSAAKVAPAFPSKPIVEPARSDASAPEPAQRMTPGPSGDN